VPQSAADRGLKIPGLRFDQGWQLGFPAKRREARRSLGYKIGEWVMTLKGLVRRTLKLLVIDEN
jgi:hypothetical protein